MNSDAKCNAWRALNRIDFFLSPGEPHSHLRNPAERRRGKENPAFPW
jgi:hypothetical protein